MLVSYGSHLNVLSVTHLVLEVLLKLSNDHNQIHKFCFYCPQEKFDLGELMLSLCYLPTAGRLTLTVVKARNLKAMDITGASGKV